MGGPQGNHQSLGRGMKSHRIDPGKIGVGYTGILQDLYGTHVPFIKGEAEEGLSREEAIGDEGRECNETMMAIQEERSSPFGLSGNEGDSLLILTEDDVQILLGRLSSPFPATACQAQEHPGPYVV